MDFIKASLTAEINNVNLRSEKHAVGDDDFEHVSAVDIKCVIAGPLTELRHFAEVDEATLATMHTVGIANLGLKREFENQKVTLKGKSNLGQVTFRECKINKVNVNMDGHEAGFCDIAFRVQTHPRADTDLGRLANMHMEVVKVSIEKEKDLLD